VLRAWVADINDDLQGADKKENASEIISPMNSNKEKY
jgi:hypothetical protein